MTQLPPTDPDAARVASPVTASAPTATWVPGEHALPPSSAAAFPAPVATPAPVAPPQTAMTFSRDGLWWWDGHRWLPTGAGAPVAGPAPRRGGTGKVVAIVLTAVLLPLVLLVLAAVAIPVFLDQRQDARDAALQTALAEVNVTQESHYLRAGTYTPSAEDLALYGFVEPDDVVVTVVSASTADYCVSVAVPGESASMWGTSDEPISEVPCG